MGACPLGRGPEEKGHAMTEQELVALAKANHPRAAGWYGTRGGATRKQVVCYACDLVLDTYAANYRRPKHVDKAVAEHLAYHLGAHK